MLEHYNPLFATYNALWELHLKGELPKGRSLHIRSQEQAIASSVALRKALATLADKTNIPSILLKNQFELGVNLLESMSHVARFIRGDDIISEGDRATASRLIEVFELYFDFDTQEDLFMEEEIDKISVIIS